MDAFSTVLDMHRARGAFVLRCEMSEPWGMEVRDEASVAVIVMVRGTAVLTAPDRTSTEVGPGDVAVVKGQQPYLFTDRVGTPPQVVVEPGGRCVNLGGQDLSTSMGLGTRTWGNAAAGDASFVTATWDLTSQATARLLDAMPATAVIPAAAWETSLVDLLVAEMTRDLPGQDAVLDRLVDVLLVAAVRHWFTERPDTAPPWWAASADPVVGQVLSWIHDRPGHPWTLDGLARDVGVSRATLSRRFADLVGQSPMAYLKDWRLARGADLLHDTEMTVERIAHTVGYASAFSFTTTFKRTYGIAPRQYRAERRDTADQGESDAPVGAPVTLSTQPAHGSRP